MLDFHGEKIYNISFIMESNNNFALSNFYLHDIGFKTHISYNSLSIYIILVLLSSNIASLFGGAKGVSLNPTRPIKFDRSINSHVWIGAPKSRYCLRVVGERV